MDDNMPNFITNYDDLVTLSNKNKQNNNSNINLDSDYNSDNLEQSFIGKMFTNLEKKI